MIRVLFVCWGNICRSPMGEYILKQLVEERGVSDHFYIASAATSSEEIGNPVYPPARRELAAHGIDCSGHAARRIRKSDAETFDYIIGMEELHLRIMRKTFGSRAEGKLFRCLEFTASPDREIDDPWYTGRFSEVYEQILEGCEGFLDYLERNHLL